MFLAQALSADRSCQNAVNDRAIKRLAGGLPLCSTTTDAYCRERRVRLVDGSTVTMPDTPAN